MAAPAFVQAGTGALWQSGTATTVSMTGVTVGNVVCFHVLVDGFSASAVLLAHSGVEDLAGTDNALTAVVSAAQCGAIASAIQDIWIGRALSTTVSLTMEQNSGVDCYGRWYEFSNVSTGTTLATVIENGTAGSTVNGKDTSATIADTGVTTLGVDRLALNFIGVNDDNQADFDTEAFTGQSGGTWVSRGSYGSATGTDGSIGLQSAAMAAAGTIDGGTLTMSASDPWGVVGFALIGTTPSGFALPFVQGFNSLRLR